MKQNRCRQVAPQTICVTLSDKSAIGQMTERQFESEAVNNA